MRHPRPHEALYESPTTRVFRAVQGDGIVICKEPFGAGAAARLRREASVLERLRGIEGVARLADRQHAPGVLSLVDCGGHPLSDLLSEGRLEPATVLAIAIQLARILSGVHRAGVVHRDINPANILLVRKREPVLIDFDLAIVAQHPTLGQDHEVGGTLAYLAPEQTGRTGHLIDQRTDLYALGVTLYEMVTGTLPFAARDKLDVVRDHLLREPAAPSHIDPGVPQALSAIILRLLAKAPAQRYQSAEGLLHDLQQLRADLERGMDRPLELGRNDFPMRLAPARLIGREAELRLLEGTLSQARWNSARTVLLEGPAGVGKSALVNEFRRLVAAREGWFVRGKFDQYRPDEAQAGALTQALGALGRLLLAQPAQELALHQRRLLEALGQGAGLMAALSPEFGLILGDGHPLPKPDPKQAEVRQHQAIVDAVRAVASPDRPLVIVLDDLQWADTQSLRGFERLANEPGLGGLVLIGVWRTGDDPKAHATPSLQAVWREPASPPLHIVLDNLGAEGMTELTGELLRMPAAGADALANTVGELTGGNPLHTVEIINALRREGVLSLRENGWRWDRDAIRRFIGHGDIVDLLAARVARLPEASRDLLRSMSCLGNLVEVELLMAATGWAEDELRATLAALLEDVLLVAEQGDGREQVRFRHDRVQQAVLEPMSEAERAQCQLRMARRLASQPRFAGHAAHQYLACLALLREASVPGEAPRVARLFHSAAQELASLANYGLAERYLAAAGALIANDDDAASEALRARIDVLRHVALYSLGRLEEADAVYAALQARAASAVEMVDPTCFQTRSLDTRGRMDESLRIGVKLLRQLGMDVPQTFASADTARRLDELGPWIAGEIASGGGANASAMQDSHTLAIARLLRWMLSSAYNSTDMDALAWMWLECRRLWCEHGPSPELVAAFARVTGMLITLRQDYRTGWEIARHAVAVGEALGFEPQTSEARCLFAAYACHWFEPLEEVLRHFERGIEGLQRSSDIALVCHARFYSIPALLDVAPTIDACDAEVEKALILCRLTGNERAEAIQTCYRRFILALRGQTKAAGSFDDEQFREAAFLARAGHLTQVRETLDILRGLNALILGDAAALNEGDGVILAASRSMPGDYKNFHAYMIRALASAWRLQAGPCPDADRLAATLASCRDWLAARAADQPANFLHLVRLVEAEQAWASGEMREALALFDAALLAAEARNRPWHRALITERAGLCHLAWGLVHTGRQLLGQALAHYHAWGAAAKVKQLLAGHAFLAEPAGNLAVRTRPDRDSGKDGSVSADAVDLVGVLRASQALSSETSLRRLVARVTEVLAALSGATGVLVLACQEDRWSLLAPPSGEPAIPVEAAAAQGLLPLSAFAYVQRTGETLNVHDVAADDRFARDPYFAGTTAACSLLVAPIAGQGDVRAMLMLENRRSEGAFNAHRLDAVRLIAGQLVVSLANAQLYESLEERVQARTRDLEQMHERLVAAARRAGKAEVASNVLHNVGNVLNSINVSASAMRNTVGQSRVEGLARAVALLNDHAGGVAAFMRDDPRADVLLNYLKELVSELRAERDSNLADLDRLTRSVDHISYVIATQQSHTGPSSVLESVRPESVLEEALRMCADSIVGRGITVVREYADVPATALDKPRLLQILVNLMRNAAQALDKVGQPLRRMVLATALFQDAGGQRLRISVQDAGEGIAPEDLVRLFSHGFTTRQDGHGFGLHSSALAAVEMGGRLLAHSDGPGRGAVFTLELPLGPRSEAAPQPEDQAQDTSPTPRKSSPDS